MNFLPSTSATTIFTEDIRKKALPSSRGNEFIGVISSIMSTDTEAMDEGSEKNTSDEENEITSPSGAKLYSFIEEDRTDYTGAPVNFSTYERDKGTISKDQVLLLRKKLKEKGAQDESIDCLNQLLASGTPLTLGTIFSSLQGTSRSSAELSDDERKTFRIIMGKLGASSDEIDSLLEGSDKGDKNAVWNKILSKLQEQQGDIQVSKKEMKSLLKSLDLSEETTSTIINNFNGEETLSLDSKKLSELLIPAEAELTNRAAAEVKIKDIMHEAMAKTLEEDKKNKVTAPIEDNRGNKRTDQSEELIQDTLKKKSGFDNFIDSINGEDKDFEEKEESSHKNPSEEKHTSTSNETSGTVNANIKASEANKEKNSVSQMFSIIETQPLENMQTASEIKDLNALAGKHRQEIFTQVQSGLLQGKVNGSKELSLELAPAELGRVNLILNIKEGEIRATIRTERQESATVIAEQMAELKAKLDEQGLKVAEIEVQVGLKEETSQSNQWNNQNDHNMMRDAQERDRSRQVANLRREAGNSSNKSLDIEQKASSQMGLHIVA